MLDHKQEGLYPADSCRNSIGCRFSSFPVFCPQGLGRFTVYHSLSIQSVVSWIIPEAVCSGLSFSWRLCTCGKWTAFMSQHYSNYTTMSRLCTNTAAASHWKWPEVRYRSASHRGGSRNFHPFIRQSAIVDVFLIAAICKSCWRSFFDCFILTNSPISRA